ncbi:MAG: DUF1553 domain-containing protein, partial [Planctomycetota bacterium]
ADRVKTTAEVFLGLTMGCAQCHDHKYDPLSQKEYYQFFAFFNQLSDRGLDGNAGRNSSPVIEAITSLPKERELETLRKDLMGLELQLSHAKSGFSEWVDDQQRQITRLGVDYEVHDLQSLGVSSPNRPGPFSVDEDGWVTLENPSGGLNAFSHSLEIPRGLRKSYRNLSGIQIRFEPLSIADDKAASDQPARESPAKLSPFEGGPKVTAVLVSSQSQPADQVDFNRQRKIAKATASSSHPDHSAVNVIDERNLQWWQPVSNEQATDLKLTFDDPIDLESDFFLSVMLFFGRQKSLPYRWKISAFSGNEQGISLPDEALKILRRDVSEWTDAEQEFVHRIFRELAPGLERLRTRIANLKERMAILTDPHRVMVMDTATKPRPTHVLARGQYDAPEELVSTGVPRALPAMTARNPKGHADRLDLARWMTSENHPLTSRVAVNRIWAMLFGRGLVTTSADFGSQGSFPSHPQLLDYLATRFIDLGWDTKQIFRDIVKSRVYRRSSVATEEVLNRDPENIWLARGARFRLSAEAIRDQALALSGLLVPRIGGPSVMPYQPPGLWKEVSHFGSTPATLQVFVQDHGEKLYRRSLYTVVKRTSPHPSMAAFDAPNREMCTVSRGVTNTPMQSLVLMNDPQFAEAARVLAAKWLEDARSDSTMRMENAFEEVVGRGANSREIESLMSLYKHMLEEFASDRDEALAVTSIGEWPRSDFDGEDLTEHAAWTQIAAVLLNLSETVTRR